MSGLIQFKLQWVKVERVQGLERSRGVLGKISGGDGKSHGGVNRTQGLEGDQWDRDVQGKGISGIWGIFFTHNYFLCYFFGASKMISMD